MLSHNNILISCLISLSFLTVSYMSGVISTQDPALSQNEPMIKYDGQLNPEVYGTSIPLSGASGISNDLALPGTAPAGLEDAEGGY